MTPLPLLLAPRRRLQGTRRQARASIQATTLDLLWIHDGVVCFAGPPGAAPSFRAVLALLGHLAHMLQVLVRTEPMDATAMAARWDARAAVLPGPLAAIAREHAAW